MVIGWLERTFTASNLVMHTSFRILLKLQSVLEPLVSLGCMISLTAWELAGHPLKHGHAMSRRARVVPPSGISHTKRPRRLSVDDLGRVCIFHVSTQRVRGREPVA